MKKSKDLILQLAAYALSIIDGLLIGAMVARHLGPEEFAVIPLFGTIQRIAVPLIAIGSSRILVKKLSTQDDDAGAAFWTFFLFKIPLSIIVYLGCLVYWGSSVDFTQFDVSTSYASILLLLVLFMPLAQFNDIIVANVLSGRSSIYTTAVTFAFSLMRIGLVFSGLSVKFFLAALVLMQVIKYLCMGYVVMQKGVIPRWNILGYQELKTLLQKSFPFLIAQFSLTTIATIDVILVNNNSTAYETGQYGLVSRLILIASSFAVIFSNTFSSQIYKDFQKEEGKLAALSRHFQAIYLVSFIVCFGIFVFTRTLFPVLYGDDYALAANWLAVLSLILPLTYSEIVRGSLIVSENKGRRYCITCFICMVWHVVVNSILIGKYGAAVCPFVALSTYLILHLFSTWYICGKNIFLIQLKSLIPRKGVVKSILKQTVHEN